MSDMTLEIVVLLGVVMAFVIVTAWLFRSTGLWDRLAERARVAEYHHRAYLMTSNEQLEAFKCVLEADSSLSQDEKGELINFATTSVAENANKDIYQGKIYGMYGQQDSSL